MNIAEKIQPYLDNTLDPTLSQRSVVTGIFGDRPSVSAKSPFLWNAAFQRLGLDASFVPFDVSRDNLSALVQTLRETPAYLGGSVTVPYKTAIMDLLDEVDNRAMQIGAVNTIARTPDGRLVGYNTDAQGAIDSLQKSTPWQPQPFIPNLSGFRVLLIGAGGAGRAVAFSVAEHIGDGGTLVIVNRSQDAGAELADSVNRAYGNATSLPERDLESALPDAQLIINTSLKGQSGLRKSAEGGTYCLEPYSSLAPANPAYVSEEQFPDGPSLFREWYRTSLDDICENHARSGQAILQSGPDAMFLDVIYSPIESALLGQARLSGHAILNGKGMNLAQAVDGFVNRVMNQYIQDQGWDIDRTYGSVCEVMAQVW